MDRRCWLRHKGDDPGAYIVSNLLLFSITNRQTQERLPAPASDVKILLCGPPPMIRAMKDATLSLGFEKARPVSKLEDQVFAF
jgi:ferredoxin-NADP reductase